MRGCRVLQLLPKIRHVPRCGRELRWLSCSPSEKPARRSVDTLTGFTPLEELVMGTRSGSVGPGILTSLIRPGQLTGDEIDRLLKHQSGLFRLPPLASRSKSKAKAWIKANGSEIATFQALGILLALRPLCSALCLEERWRERDDRTYGSLRQNPGAAPQFTAETRFK